MKAASQHFFVSRITVPKIAEKLRHCSVLHCGNRSVSAPLEHRILLKPALSLLREGFKPCYGRIMG